MGCMAQLQQGRDPGARAVRGPRLRLARHRPRRRAGGDARDAGRRPGARDRRGRRSSRSPRGPTGGRRLKAFVTVMEGCEKHCTFCVVPTTRGRERSHPPETIVDEIRGLAAAGCREVTLLGQTVNAYGRDLDPATDLAELLERVDDIDGIERIRFTTSNPYNLTPRLIRAIRDVPKVVRVPAPAAAVGLGPRARPDEPRLHPRALPRADRGAQGDGARPRALHRSHRGLPGRDRGGLRATRWRWSRRSATTTSSPSGTRAGRARPRRRWRSGARSGEGRAQPAHPRGRDPGGRRAQPASRGPRRCRSWWTASRARTRGEATGRTRCNRVVNFDRRRSRPAGPRGAGAHHRGAAAQPPRRARGRRTLAGRS